MNTNRTCWQCFQHYQKYLDPDRRNDTWSKDEAELLLKTIASEGPTFVLNKAAATEITMHNFPNRSSRQVYLNAHKSIGINPLLTYGEWTEEEEMTLCLAMKAYQNSSRPIKKVQCHIPNRAAKQIAEKWNYSLNPSIQMTPCTREEDVRLLHLLKYFGTTENWKEILKYFPNRDIKQLKQRRDKILDANSYIKRVEDTFKNRQIPMSINISADDFIIRSKRKADDDIFDSE